MSTVISIPQVVAGAVVIGTTEITGGTAGSVLFVAADGTLGQDNANFFFDDTANSLTLGGAAVASVKLMVRTGADATKGLVVRGNSATQSANILEAQDSGGVARFLVDSVGRPSAPTTGARSERFGALSLPYASTGIENVAVGYEAMNANTSGEANVALGYRALFKNTTGLVNLAMGSLAMEENTSGTSNTAIGAWAFRKNTTASEGTAIGQACFWQNTTGTGNVGIGYAAGYSNTTGSGNLCIGSYSFFTSVTGGSFNIAVGGFSMFSSTGAEACTAIGYNSLAALTTGDELVAIGYNAGSALTTGASGTLIGAFSEAAAVDSQHFVGIGHSAIAASNECSFGPYVNLIKVHGNSTTTNRPRFHLLATDVDNTDATRMYRLSLHAWDTAAREGLRIEGSGSAPLVGFYGVAAVARPGAYTQTYATADKTHANLTSATLTDNSGGTANTTVQALTDPADTPAVADVLRDDLVANLIPELRNNFADVVAQINALRVDLEDVKQLANSMIDDLQALGLMQ